MTTKKLSKEIMEIFLTLVKPEDMEEHLQQPLSF
jgi:hypothetical protein